MMRVLLFLLAFGAVGAGASSLPPRAPPIALSWAGYHVSAPVPILFAVIALTTLAMIVAWTLLRFAHSRFQRGHR